MWVHLLEEKVGMAFEWCDYEAVEKLLLMLGGLTNRTSKPF
jgi:hypothetical protein